MNTLFRFLLVFFLVIEALFSCNNSSHECYRDNTFEYLMADFYAYNLRYPQTGSDFCYLFYKHDSIQQFSYINGQLDFLIEESYLDVDTRDFSKYDNYVQMMIRIDKTIDKEKLHNSYLNFVCHIFSNPNIISFGEDSDKVFMIHTKEFYDIWGENCKVWLSDYMNSTFDIYKNNITQLRFAKNFMSLNIYSSDSLLLTSFSDDESIAVRKRFSDLLYNEFYRIVYEDDSIKYPLRSLIRYMGNGNYTNISDTTPLKKELTDNINITNFLDSCLLKNGNGSFAQFSIVSETKGK